ncbi:Phospholipid-transporting ATPase ID [Desmophyllum pertusum]|uniref:Phospholipid-transporting ATPase n=1 Tax=Desmophyllum pertusum TaxID=174260 RepID=A0A9W9ZR01_9CNID|nr:Phospholipid-transporting ATPase ID [Desmophyllum pertusum]
MKTRTATVSVKQQATERQLRTNDHEHNSTFQYVNNYIKTSKYTLLTFLPLNLFEQFQRIANIYFLLQIIIMSIPKITALSPEATAVPLVCVLAATGIKDAADDIKRHKSDDEVNNRKAKVLAEKGQKEERWMKLQVGDVLRIDSNDQIPADIVVLTTSEDNGLCYIETAELDGETNLKCRQPHPETGELGDDEEQLSQVKMEISCEPPNNRLDKFKGKLVYEDTEYPLDNENVILRGCVLRNTKWVYGVVIYAGHDTKLMMNTGVSKFKRTGLDKLTNSLILWIAFMLGIICTFCAIATTVWEEIIGQHFQGYIPWEDFYSDSVVVIGIVHWPSFIMVLNTLIPISLYISVEVIRLGQSLWINWDINMYYEKKDTPAVARTTTLTEELGQIQYIFSDKTGTLTQNVMTFKKCSINGRIFGHPPVCASVRQHPSKHMTHNNSCQFHSCFFDCPLHVPTQRHIEGESAGNPEETLLSSVSIREEGECHELFRLLAVCHTVMVETNNGNLEYQAQSPDEAALVTAARNFGFTFVGRSPTTITIDVLGEEEMYELLAILDFNNERKRMSVIVRRNDQITLYCKGADTIVYEHLDRSCKPLMTKTMKHLNVFAAEGLRTLVTAYKDIPPDVYKEWEVKFREASLAMDDRDELVQQAYEDIEQNLILIGATAIEDKLQDDVPDTIATLAEADIKIWVLTGDKVETAINIGYSCHLLTDDMTEVFTIDGETLESVQQAISEYKNKVMAERQHLKCIVKKTASRMWRLKSYRTKITIWARYHPLHRTQRNKTPSDLLFLAFALHESLEKEFLTLACLCKAGNVIIYPTLYVYVQALVVQLVKNNLQAVTLAIGDGANDVSMIKAAHIGVGISGQEGMQAVLASDFSFAQILHSPCVNCGTHFILVFSAQTLYDAWFISFYNVFFTSAPIVFLAVLDQDVSEASCAKYPRLYIPGQKNLLFNKKIFCLSLLYGTLVSLGIFFVSYGAFGHTIASDGLETSSVSFFGTVVAAILVVVVNIEISFLTQHWTWINHFFIWGSILFYFAFYFVFYAEFVFNLFPQNHYYGMQFEVYGNGAFWFCLFLVLAVSITPRLSYYFIQNELYPTLSDTVRRQEAHKRVRSSVPLVEFKPQLVRRRSSKRSSYAFAHQEGFGKIVMSPATFLRKKLRSGPLGKSNVTTL